MREQINAIADAQGLIPINCIFQTKSGENVEIKFEKSHDDSQDDLVDQHDSQDDLLDQHDSQDDLLDQQLPEMDDNSEKKKESEKEEKIKSIIYVLDRFNISMEGYHELSQIFPDLPRSYLVQGCQRFMNNTFDIEETPGESMGAQVNLLSELQHDTALKSINDEFTLKISADGTKISRSSTIVVCTYSVLSQSDGTMSTTGNKVLAIVKCDESYELLKVAFADIVNQVEEISRKQFIEYNGKQLKVNLIIGGDMKFLLLCLGMKAATSNNSCIYCDIDKDKRHKFNVDGKQRTINKNWFKQPGCHSMPIFSNIPVENYLVDELHLLLRVTDRLEEGIIMTVIEHDQKEKTDLKSSLLRNVQDCGVTLSIWKAAKNKYEWTSLMGGDKKKLLKKLPEKFENFLPTEQVPKTKKLWEDFLWIYNAINEIGLTEDAIRNIQKKSIAWGENLCKMNGCGYDQAQPITPYIHILIKHIPSFLRRYGSMKYFSGQGVEKKNDDLRKIFHRKINKQDACKSMLKVEKRAAELEDDGFKRQKRHYKKHEI